MADLLFVHPQFPGQFVWLARHLQASGAHRIKALALAGSKARHETAIEGIEAIPYGAEVSADRPPQHVLHHTENFIRHAASLALAADGLRRQGFDPEVIYVHAGWGAGAFLHNVFPRAKLIKYCEWYYNKPATGIRFLKRDQPVERIIADDLLNLPVLAELAHFDRLIAPTEWQRGQFPAVYRDRIAVLPDGLDPMLFEPRDNPEFRLSDGRVLRPEDRVVTYVARGADRFRGFETFIEALALLQSRGADFRCLIAGDTHSHYGPEHGTDAHFRAVMDRVALDQRRVHFLGKIERERFIDLLRVSSAHVYLTVPFVLSWSLLEAMAAGCAVIASDTPPVAEFIADGVNGRLVDFFEPGMLSAAIARTLEETAAGGAMRERARQTVRRRWALEGALDAHLKLLGEVLAEVRRN